MVHSGKLGKIKNIAMPFAWRTQELTDDLDTLFLLATVRVLLISPYSNKHSCRFIGDIVIEMKQFNKYTSSKNAQKKFCIITII